MKRFSYFFIILIVFSAFQLISQERIVVLDNGKRALLKTDNTWTVLQEADTIVLVSGEVIILNPDSTWGYMMPADSGAVVLKKPKGADYLLESEKGPYGLWMNLKKWDVNDGKSPNPEVDLKFLNKDKSAFGLTIFSKNIISLDSLKNQALMNYKQAAPDTRFVNEQLYWINGTKFLAVEMHATLKSGPMVYFNYYAAGLFGTIQASVFTKQSGADKIKEDVLELFSGLVVFTSIKK